MCICRKSAVSASIDNCAPASRRRTSITTLSFAKKAGVALNRRLSAWLKASTFAVLMISTSASKTLWRSSKQGILRSSMSEPNGKLAAKLGILNLIGVSHSRAGEARRRRQYNEYGKGAEASPLQMRANQRMLQSMRQSLENASLQSYKTQFLEHPECKVHVFHKNFHSNQVLEALNRKLKSNQSFVFFKQKTAYEISFGLEQLIRPPRVRLAVFYFYESLCHEVELCTQPQL